MNNYVRQTLRRNNRFTDPRYKPWRDTVMKNAGYKCEICGEPAKDKGGRGLHAHHLRGWRRYPALRYVVANGMAVCKPCHFRIHGRVF